jgi:hypothetical protein
MFSFSIGTIHPDRAFQLFGAFVILLPGCRKRIIQVHGLLCLLLKFFFKACSPRISFTVLFIRPNNSRGAPGVLFAFTGSNSMLFFTRFQFQTGCVLWIHDPQANIDPVEQFFVLRRKTPDEAVPSPYQSPTGQIHQPGREG